MRRYFSAAVSIIASLSLGAFSLSASEVTPFGGAGQVQRSASSGDPPMPVYKAPKDRVPRARMDGGLRGGKESEPFLHVFAPDHVGVTINKAPCLYWHVSQKTSFPVEFTLENNRVTRPVVETPIPPPARAGVQKVCLENHHVTLVPGVQYRWHISLIVDPETRSKDIHAMGTIERMDFNECSTLGLPCSWACDKDAVYRYAEAGFWYDAIECVSDLIEASPEDRTLQNMRDALLGQSGLSFPVFYDRGGF